MDENDNDSSKDVVPESDESKIEEDVAQKFLSKLTIRSHSRINLPMKYQRYFGKDFEKYRKEKCETRIKTCDFKTLEPEKYLNDTIIECYLNLITQRAKLDPTLPKVYNFGCFFYNKLRTHNYTGVKSWINEAIFSFDYLLFPIHEPAHWLIIIVDVHAKVIGAFDSLRHDNTHHLEYIKKFLIEYAEAMEDYGFRYCDWEFFNDKTAPTQRNGFDCGVYACQYAAFITCRRELSFQQSQMNYYRKRMRYELLVGKLLKDPII